jgi:hypothetical protein
MNGDGIVPPQGLNIINEKKILYGLPLGIPTGGGGTKVTAQFPQALKFPSGMSVKITGGTYSPAPKPPIHTGDNDVLRCGSGAIVRIVTPTGIKTGGGGTTVKIVTPIKIQMGGGMKTANV